MRHLAPFVHHLTVSHLPPRPPPVRFCATCFSVGYRPTDHPLKPETSATFLAKRISHQCRGGPSHSAVDRHRLPVDEPRAVRRTFDFLHRRYGRHLRRQLGRAKHPPFTGERERRKKIRGVLTLILGVSFRFPKRQQQKKSYPSSTVYKSLMCPKIVFFVTAPPANPITHLSQMKSTFIQLILSTSTFIQCTVFRSVLHSVYD